jgi:hypothetical protein
MPIKKLLMEMSSADISEYMAMDLLKDQDQYDRLKSETMTAEQRDIEIKRLLGFNNGNN